MRATGLVFSAAALFLAGTMAQAASVSGTVTNKTTGKPSAGDQVVLVEPQSGMAEVVKTTTDGRGHYTMNLPGANPYLVKVTHQGATYFIAAPDGGGAGDVSVYDVKAKVDGIFCEADVYEIEAANGQLHVTERYFIHNTSTPPTTEWSPHTFEIVLPAEAVLTTAEAQRPTGLPTGVKLDPVGAKGHYAFSTPIDPDQGEKDTQFQISYTIPYAGGKYTFHPSVTLPTQSVGVLLPKSVTFKAGAGSTFQTLNQDPGVQTFVAKNAVPGKVLEFTISGEGSMPRENQGGGSDASGQTAGGAPANGQPGGGIGAPINTPDPLSKYKWWILSALALLLVGAAAFLLRKPAGTAAVAAPGTPATPGAAANHAVAATPAGKNGALLAALKDELFALESEKLSGSLDEAEYARVKAALEVVLKRALHKNK